MTDIKFLKDRIIFDGHSDTREECETITLMCDNLVKSKDFKTVKYESGYAEFERVGNSNELKFAPSIGTLTINFDSHITKVVATEHDLEWTTSGQTNNVNVLVSDGGWLFTVTLESGYVIDTVTPSSSESLTTISNITDTTFVSNMGDGSETQMELTITSKKAVPPYSFKHYSAKSRLPGLIDGSITELNDDDFEGIRSIRAYAFYGTKITKIVIPDNIINIGNSAFAYNTALTELIMADSVTTIGSQLCMGCSALTTVTLSAGITRIPTQSFSSCSKLTSITIPSNITTIADTALVIGSTTNKATITMLSSTPPTIASSTFVASRLNKIIVPAGTASTYKAATNWAAFADYIEEETNGYTVTITSKTGDEYNAGGSIIGGINRVPIDGDSDFDIYISDTSNSQNIFYNAGSSLTYENVSQINIVSSDGMYVLSYVLNGIETMWGKADLLTINITEDSTLEIITQHLD